MIDRSRLSSCPDDRDKFFLKMEGKRGEGLGDAGTKKGGAGRVDRTPLLFSFYGLIVVVGLGGGCGGALLHGGRRGRDHGGGAGGWRRRDDRGAGGRGRSGRRGGGCALGGAGVVREGEAGAGQDGAQRHYGEDGCFHRFWRSIACACLAEMGSSCSARGSSWVPAGGEVGGRAGEVHELPSQKTRGAFNLLPDFTSARGRERGEVSFRPPVLGGKERRGSELDKRDQFR